MPPSIRVDDPVLDYILASGEFDSCLRSGCGGTSGSLLAAFLIGRYTGLTGIGAQLLSGYIDSARSAGRVLLGLPPGATMPLDAIPLIQGVGGPSIDGARIAAIAHFSWTEDGAETMTGFDASVQFVNEPTIDDMYAQSQTARAQRYDTVPFEGGDDWTLSAPPITISVQGLYRAY